MPCRSLAVVFVLSTLVLAACDQRAPTDAAPNAGPQAVILDGSSGGNAHFFFLPPIVNKAEFSGEFNGNLAPTVEICTNTQQDVAGHCVSLLARFRRFPEAGDASEAVAVSLAGQHYTLNWNTKNYNVPLDAPFRVVVLIGDVQLGHVDLIRPTQNSFRNHATGSVINRTTNGALPISFRIERGALCGNSVECFEGSVGPDGGTFTIERNDGTRPAGTEFPSGALESTVNLIIERYFGECVPTDAPQYQGCYRFRTEPYVEEFELPATVGVCLFDASALSYQDDDQLRLWKWSEVEGDPIEELERVTIDYLVCPELGAIGARASSPRMLALERATSLLLKPLAHLLLPREAYAFAVNEGGKLINFSRIGWVRPLAVEIRAGDGQTGFAGTALPDALMVRVVNKYGHTVQGVPGRAVTFTPSADGSAQPPATFTDVLGEASTVWTLATTPGANTLRALSPTSRVIAPSPYEAEAFFNATGTPPYKLVWQPGLVPTRDLSGTFITGLQPLVEVSVVEGAVLLQIPMTTWPDVYYGEWHFGQLDPNLTYRLTAKLGGFSLGHQDVRLEDGTLRNVATGTTVAHPAFETYLRVKFRLVQ